MSVGDLTIVGTNVLVYKNILDFKFPFLNLFEVLKLIPLMHWHSFEVKATFIEMRKSLCYRKDVGMLFMTIVYLF